MPSLRAAFGHPRISPLIFLFYICAVLILTGSPTNGLPCSYQNPRVEDVVMHVDLDGDDERREGNEEEGPRRSKREILMEKEFLPLRIHLHYDQTILDLPPEKQSYVNGSLIPQASGFWETTLRVRRHTGNLLLRRRCSESYFLWDKERRSLACGKGCSAVTTCGDIEIPPSHLKACHYCDQQPQKCFMTGAAGEGVPSADFVLYVSSKNTPRCSRNDTLAYAAHCQLESILDRPVAGHVNLCPAALSTHSHDQEVLTSTVKHEMLHALGFSAGLFAFYRNDDGTPRTKRNQYGKPFNLNKEKGYYEWDKNTIDTILRTDWWTAEGEVVHPVQMVVTPRVKRESRRHFGCSRLEGAELENQGGEGTALTHWEKRVYENEAMTGTHTQNPVYSRLTLALLEDTGWYRTNYDVAESLHWGAGLGCEFAMKSCGDWIARRRQNNTVLAPFCDKIKHDGRRSLAVTTCNLQRDSVALCNLIPYREELPRPFRNLDQLTGVQKQGLPYYGGSVELADYCPFIQEFEWKGSETERRRDSRCEIATNQLEGDQLMEIYGEESRCIDLVKPWTERKCSRLRTYSNFMAGCYERSCINGTLHIGVANGTRLYPCHYEGQHVHIRMIVDGWLREGTLSCPPCSELCEECRLDTEYENGTAFIGDDPIDEPCAAHTRPLAMALIMLFIFLRVFG